MSAIDRTDHQLSPDFIPLEKRRADLYIRTYKISEDGTRYDESLVELVESEPSAHACHPSATWPSCDCPRCRPSAPMEGAPS